MKPDAHMLQEAQVQQAQASDPGVSAWVGASAGTGKTRVLTDRILRLLLEEEGIDPAHIVAITFGRLAAAEIFDKLMERLSPWLDMAEVTLRAELAVLLGHPPTQAQLAQARQLPDILLETPPRIATLDGFCHSILQRFPLEAGVPPGFEVLDEEAGARLTYQALEKTLTMLAQDKGEAGQAFARLVTMVPERGLRETLVKLVQQRAVWEEMMEKAGGLDCLLEKLARALSLDPDWREEEMESYIATTWLPDAGEQEELCALTDWLKAGKKTSRQMGERLVAFLALSPAQQCQRWRLYRDIFFTVGDNPTPRTRLADSDRVAQAPEKAEQLAREQERLIRVEEGRRARVVYHQSAALLLVGQQVLQTYQQLKVAQSALDFTDLVVRTVRLLRNPQLGAWVQYRLDKAIHHILVDEAQDTSLGQWHVIEALMEEVLAGEGQHAQSRTLFAVGDIKQSIYRFRGAEPRVFEHMWQALQQGDATGEKTRRVPLTTSFRSSPAVLQAVDQVFADIALEEKMQEHQSVYPGRFGRVELWGLCRDDAKSQPPRKSWQLPSYEPQASTPRRRVATRVAETVKSLAEGPTILAATGQPVNYGDMMILLRGRTMLPTIISCLQAWEVPYVDTTGQDGCDHILIQDLVALGLCVTNPGDSLALAQVLKSPLFCWADEDVLTLRGSPALLWEALQARGGPAADILHGLQQKAATSSPHEFYVEALRQTEARGRYMHRLGQVRSAAARRAVNQLIDTFLDAALEAESLAGFLHDLQRQGLSLGGMPDKAVDAVRIMTVHKAKGLEAPIVFLPDTMAAYDGNLGREKLLWSDDMVLASTASEEGKSALQTRLLQEEKEKRQQDEQRLLYVAMTRAQEYLYIGGAAGKNQQQRNWYELVKAVAHQKNGWSPQGQDWVLSSGLPPRPAEKLEETEPKGEPPPLPDWATQKAPAERVTRQRATEKSRHDPAAAARGEKLHRLLDILPRYEQDQWESLAPGVPDMHATVRAVMAQYPWLFGQNTRAEVPLGTQTVAGVVDRLVVTEQEVRIIDYKTDRTVPAQVPAIYREQLKTYADIVKDVYPDRAVKAGILWTETLTLDWVDTG
jgi:ATP-dependent helicase/nuclease subunit A